MSRKPAVTPYFKAHEATILALLPQMPVRTAVLVLLAGRENYRRKGASIGALLDSLKCPPRTLQNVLDLMSKAGEVLIDGQTVTLTATPLASSSRPLSRPSSMGKRREKKPVADAVQATPDLHDSLDSLEERTTTPPTPPQAGGDTTQPQAGAVIPFQSGTTATPEATPVVSEQPRPTPRKRSRKVPAAPAPFPEPSERLASIPGFLERWADWQVTLEERGAPMTPTTAKYQLRKLEADPDPVGMLEYSLGGSPKWRSLYSDRNSFKRAGGGKPASGEDANERLREGFARRRLLLQGGGHAA